ncbi:MAG TPA: C39 family peptidase [Candidatus Hydrogenedentes bacterium]|nr:C39 family peptidase [Candidatus Hydrogenedentota bacterium]HOS02983.1 C39 family peptidase [Candidatus Hydrogenedentota bacterium]
MQTRLWLDILPQPDDVTCGPTCLHAIYRYYGDVMPLPQLIAETPQLKRGGTLAVLLACHALRRGYKATIYTYNLHMFDPTWFNPLVRNLPDRLKAQATEAGKPSRIRQATRWYLEFLALGGKLRFEDLTAALIQRYLKRGVPILTGLSATYLYRTAREYGVNSDYDDVRGEPAGHFVVLSGYDKKKHEVTVADPLEHNPVASTRYYAVKINRALGAILLGIITHDANLLIIEPEVAQSGRKHARTHRRK